MDETSLIKLEVTDDGSTEFGTYWKAVMSNFKKIDDFMVAFKSTIETSISDTLASAKEYSDTNLAAAKAYTDSAIATAITSTLEATY